MKRQWVVDTNDDSIRIDEFAYRHGLNKKLLKAIKMRGDILVDGVHQTVRYLVHQGETVTFLYPPEKNQIMPVEMDLKIVYEDDYLLVIDKPKGLPCIPTLAHPCWTLANGLSAYYQQIGLCSTVHLVNRLDKDTSGLLIVAKYREIHDLLTKEIKHIYRQYQAHVMGKTTQGAIRLPIYREGHSMKRIIDKRGQPSCTYYRTLDYQAQTSFVKFVLETGRTHQIRVHMAAIGHPLIGDTLYGDGQGHFDLESVMIAFTHPVTQQLITIKKCS